VQRAQGRLGAAAGAYRLALPWSTASSNTDVSVCRTKRHIAVDVIGLLLTVLITAASVQDRDAA